jgi:hypothetical protein
MRVAVAVQPFIRVLVALAVLVVVGKAVHRALML